MVNRVLDCKCAGIVMDCDCLRPVSTARASYFVHALYLWYSEGLLVLSIWCTCSNHSRPYLFFFNSLSDTNYFKFLPCSFVIVGLLPLEISSLVIILIVRMRSLQTEVHYRIKLVVALLRFYKILIRPFI